MKKQRQPMVMVLSLILCHLYIGQVAAQKAMTVEECMRYAVAHNHEVRLATMRLDNYHASRQQAIGNFLPYVEAGVGGQYNFGRAIDPETNTYTNVSTFYNGYSLSATLPVFDGFSRLHALKAAKADVLMGKSAVQQQRDQTALATYQAFIDVLYYQGLVKLAEMKVEEQTALLRMTRVMEEVGQKSMTDVAQIEAQQAEADYNLTHQRNLLESSLLTLKKTMNYPLEEDLTILPLTPPSKETNDHSYKTINISTNRGTKPITPLPTGRGRGEGLLWGEGLLLPLLQQSHYAQQSALHQWRQARAAFFPSLSLGAGLSTTYYKTLHASNTVSFSQQFHNNMGEYVSLTLSIPLFNRLRTVNNVRRAKNNYMMAQETYAQQVDELHKLTVEAALEVENYQRESFQMQRKVSADSLAYALVKRKFEEGLLSATDLQTSAATLLQSEVTLLQKRLTVCLKQRLLDYYTGNGMPYDN